MRALAYIAKITKIIPISGAETIELVQINDAWQCVTKRGNFVEGDNAVYFEMDSLLPITDDRFGLPAEKAITFDGKKYNRIKHRTFMKEHISQGYALPVSVFQELKDANLGDDVSTILNIVKWEPTIPACLGGDISGGFPSYVRKTDQERIQNKVSEYAFKSNIIGHVFEESIKLDGASETVAYHDGKVDVCGRNWAYYQTNGNAYWNAAINQGIIAALTAYNNNIALQGELCGPAIQGNNEKLKKPTFYLFDVYIIDEKRYASNDERVQILYDLHRLGAEVQSVPRKLIQFGGTTDNPDIEIIPITDDMSGTEIMNVILQRADGPSMFGKNREGHVYKRHDGKYSFKAISNWYLGKYGDR